MKINHVNGKDKGKVMLYTLSTCGWCKKTKEYLKRIDIAYDFIDVDLLDTSEKNEVMEIIQKWNPRGSFPTIVINDQTCIVGFDEHKLKAELSK